VPSAFPLIVVVDRADSLTHPPPLGSFSTDWRPEQAEALQQFSTWRDTLVESDTSNESSESGLPTSGADEWFVDLACAIALAFLQQRANDPPPLFPAELRSFDPS
jgi:hypothetical protein